MVKKKQKKEQLTSLQQMKGKTIQGFDKLYTRDGTGMVIKFTDGSFIRIIPPRMNVLK